MANHSVKSTNDWQSFCQNFSQNTCCVRRSIVSYWYQWLSFAGHEIHHFDLYPSSHLLQVLMVELKKNKRIYAMKVIKKELVTDDEDIDWVQTEKHVFETASNHPFLVGLHSCFQVIRSQISPPNAMSSGTATTYFRSRQWAMCKFSSTSSRIPSKKGKPHWDIRSTTNT